MDRIWHALPLRTTFCVKSSLFDELKLPLYMSSYLCAKELKKLKCNSIATAIQDYAYVRSLRGIEGWQASSRRRDFS